MVNEKEKLNLGILTFPIGKTGNTPLSHLIDILISFNGEVSVITGNEGYAKFKDDKRIHTCGMWHKESKNSIERILRYVHAQFKLSYYLISSKKVDIWIFFISADTLILPMLVAKLMNKTVFLMFAGSTQLKLKSDEDKFVGLMAFLSRINCTLSNKIILYSKILLKEWKLEKYEKKVIYANEHFIDMDSFHKKNEIFCRNNVVGYVGSFSNEKGIMNLMNAISIISRSGNNNLEFMVIGDGYLRKNINEFVEKNNLQGTLRVCNWVDHNDLPSHLNKMQLMILPSYTEGLPNVVLEAMACGTPVLATPVGSVPDLIEDGVTGFLMEDNSPECIAKNITRALEHPELEKISENALKLIKNNFTFSNKVKNWKQLVHY